MSDLRQRLIAEIRVIPTSDTYLHGDSADEIADAALAVFAGWLRERADDNPYVLWQPKDATEALRVLADEIASTGGEG